MRLYNISFKKLVASLLPFSLRDALTELIFAIILPVRTLHTSFKDYRFSKVKALSYNCQYPNFQRLLNDRFDNVEGKRRILVYDSFESIWSTIAYDSGLKGKRQLRTVFAVHSWRTWGYKPFTVSLPCEFEEDKNKIKQIKRIVNMYKFAGTTYQIIYQNQFHYHSNLKKTKTKLSKSNHH
jgi:hypothetical protein